MREAFYNSTYLILTLTSALTLLDSGLTATLLVRTVL
jgi:hypothetical protein